MGRARRRIYCAPADWRLLRRDGFLVDIDLDRLRASVTDYFGPDARYEEFARRHSAATETTTGYNARKVRDALLACGGTNGEGLVRFAFRPYDTRWLYWEADGGLLDRPRPDYMPHVFEGNLWIEAREREAKEDFSRGTVVRFLADNFRKWAVELFPASRLE